MPQITRLAVVAVTLLCCAEEAMAQCQPSVQRLIVDRRYDEARAQMAAAVAKNPKDNIALECMGRIAVETNRPREAAEYFEKAIEIE